MRPSISAALVYVTLSACSPSPVAVWQGAVSLEAADGNIYQNSLEILADGSASTQLYFLVDGEAGARFIEDYQFTGTWTDESELVFDWTCSEGCEFSSTWSCVFQDTPDELACTSDVAIYANEDQALRWSR